MIVTLENTEQSLAFGKKLGQILVNTRPFPTLLLHGDLGAGKTTMVRGLVQGLPGWEQAEVTSPSFNLVNHYPTTPPVAHVDLYRLEAGSKMDNEIFEVLEDQESFVVVEWAERLAESDRPPRALTLIWSVYGTLRRVEFQASDKTLLDSISLAFA